MVLWSVIGKRVEVLRLLEFEADGFATMSSIANNSITNSYSDGVALHVADGIGRPKVEMDFYIWSYSINSVLKLLSQYSPELTAQGDSHPSPNIRIMANDLTVSLLNKMHERDDWDAVHTQFCTGRVHVEKLWKEFSIPGSQIDPYSDKSLSEVKEIFSDIFSDVKENYSYIQPWIKRNFLDGVLQGAKADWNYAKKC